MNTTNRLKIPPWVKRAKKADKTPFVFLFFIYSVGSLAQLGYLIISFFFLAEDRLLESLSAIFLLVSSILLFLSARQAKTNRKLKNHLYLLIGIGTALFLWFAEEISWGQRILNFSIESIEAINTQGEANIHNLAFIQPCLHLSYGVIFLIVAFLCVAPRRKQLQVHNMMPSPDIFYYFILPAAYYFIGEILSEIPIEIRGYTFEHEHIFKYQEAYEFILATGTLKYAVEKFKAISRLKK